MIQANELRVGNLLNYDTAEGDVVTCPTDYHSIHWATDDPKGFNLVHTPIPLTEEWLVKFGFEYFFELNRYYNKHPLQLFFSPNGFEYFHAQFAGKFIVMKYVHQLQNLYFALTGEELTTTH